jgi:hypothetical protein
VKLLRNAYPELDDATRRAEVFRAIGAAFKIEPAAVEDIIARLDGPGGRTIN